ncbi:MAG: hypothetical protein MI919_19005 [Holophagales bacterium]|nr:hypothetical protein [Holophagales bacterium]
MPRRAPASAPTQAAENTDLSGHQQEVQRLQLEAKVGRITPAGRARLGTLQAKLDQHLRRRLGRASRLGHHVADVVTPTRASPGKGAAARDRKAASGSGADEAMIQRKVGFEFQTGWQIESAIGLPLATTSITKNTPLVQGSDWKLTRDDGDAEFVTDAVEEGDRQGLIDLFTELRGFTESLISSSQDPIPTRDLGGATFLGKTTRIRKGNNAMPANPQLSAGVDLAQLTKVMRQLGNRQDPNNAKFVGARQTLMADLGQTTLNQVSAEYEGLVALMASYVHLSSGLAAFADTPKNITSLMSRTNMAQVYGLTRESQQVGSASAKANQLVFDIVQAARAATPPTRTFNPIRGNMKLVPPSIDTLQKATGNMDQLVVSLRTGPTLQEWADGIVAGKDLLSGLSTVRNVSMGSKGTEDVSNIRRPSGEFTGIFRKKGLILEFRDLKKQIPQKDWGDWALALFDWITLINDPSSRVSGLLDQGNEVSSNFDMQQLLASISNPDPVNVRDDTDMFPL